MSDDTGKNQRDRTQAALQAALDEHDFNFGVLVTLVRQADGRSRVECAVSGTGPPGMGPIVGKLLRQAADQLEQDLNEQSAKLLGRLS